MKGKSVKITERQAAILTAHTGIVHAGTGAEGNGFHAFHQYAEELCGRPVWTHEFALKEMCDKIKRLSKPDFLALPVDVKAAAMWEAEA